MTPKNDAIQELLTRGVANIIPSQDKLQLLLQTGKKLNIYCGFDATAPKLTLGHTVPFRKLQTFADAGHHVTFLIGDFTTRVGDTSDKNSERPILTPEEIKQNWQTYKQQASRIIDFKKIQVKFNSEWLSKLSFIDVIKLTQQFSLGDFVSRELIKKRLQEGKHVSLQEGLYPVMQGYDHWYLDTDLQIGATEQTFNMQAGRTLQKKWRNKESFIMTLQILEGTDGRKMSKTWNNAIWLEDPPDQIFGKVMSLADDLIIPYFTLATNASLEKINQIASELGQEPLLTSPFRLKADGPLAQEGRDFPLFAKEGVRGSSTINPIDIKKRLAHQITMELHDKKAADQAQVEFEKVYQQSQIPTEIPEFPTSQTDWDPVELLVATKLVSSKSAARRLIQQGGLKINQKKFTDLQNHVKIVSGNILQAGKHKFIKLITKN